MNPTGTTDKEMFVAPGATHIQTYYVAEYVEKERARLVSFFNSNLAEKALQTNRLTEEGVLTHSR